MAAAAAGVEFDYCYYGSRRRRRVDHVDQILNDNSVLPKAIVELQEIVRSGKGTKRFQRSMKKKLKKKYYSHQRRMKARRDAHLFYKIEEERLKGDASKISSRVNRKGGRRMRLYDEYDCEAGRGCSRLRCCAVCGVYYCGGTHKEYADKCPDHYPIRRFRW